MTNDVTNDDHTNQKIGVANACLGPIAELVDQHQKGRFKQRSLKVLIAT